MRIFTLNVGQGQFVVVTGRREAFIVDTYVPLNPAFPIVNVKSALARILSGKELIGLVITGFDSDHFNEVGLKIVLNKYRPNWLMYPKYFKQTRTADACFRAISDFQDQKSIDRISVSLDRLENRILDDLSTEFNFEVFSPHIEDMNSSNNCSLVCKVTEVATNATYLITGDTEADRWDSILGYFEDDLASDVLAAPHHGSKNGISFEAMSAIDPTTVIVSAGVGNQFGHPHRDAISIFEAYADSWFSTSDDGGVSLQTIVTAATVETIEFD